ncbi:PIG-X [Mycena belliarum]|uniref:Protein PBN1 n=1 Tax=Mycena belliarum TaxID=1033014 RepID=A0AAD6UM60_9AGAR|nr:PIG-X [Mycena belliae]
MQVSSLLHKQSFHPVFKTSISAAGFEECALHLHYTLPVMVFVDPFELGNRADAYSFEYVGPSNLELPVAALPDESSALLINVVGNQNDVEVPLHVRYPDAAAAKPFRHTELPWPEAFFACPVTGPGTDALPIMPRPFATLFQNSSIFRLKTPSESARVEVITTPVGDTADVALVELGTALVVLVSFFYLVRTVHRTVVRMRSGLPLKED